MIRIGIGGISGRMGQTILHLLNQSDDLCLAGAVEAPGSKAVGTEITTGKEPVTVSDRVDFTADVVIDFSSPVGTAANLKQAAEGAFGLVIGTTGLTAEHDTLINAAAQKVPVLVAPNMSVGMNYLFELVQQAAQRFGIDYDIEILETHHRHKKDAPSGSAKELLARAVKGRGKAESVAYGREGMTGARAPGSIGVHAIRGGDVVGDHTVVFAGQGERLELTHKASSRECFAQGALQAARFVANAQPGRYSMADLLASGTGSQP